MSELWEESAELVRAGWVRDSGVRDTISTGRKAVCWEAVS